MHLASIIQQIEEQSSSIPVELRRPLAPATHLLYEWKDYWLELPEADQLRVGIETIKPVRGHLYHIRFENQIGLASIQPFAGRLPLCSPLRVEVISPKFPTAKSHLDFYQNLLDDLFARAARIPFTISAQTGRGVAESHRPPTPLFVLHFICQSALALQTALNIIKANPHRVLGDFPARVPLAEAKEANVDVLTNILYENDNWVPAKGFLLANRLGGYAPERVWQRLSEETLDTPENRFVLDFLRELSGGIDGLPAQRWWSNVAPERQSIVYEMSSLLRQSISHPMFRNVGALQVIPLHSQVMLRREGYRDLMILWQLFHQARRPLFEPLRHMIDVRDIATLYETWVFFALVDEIAEITGEAPAINLQILDDTGLAWGARARFGHSGDLLYNANRSSYSIPLRPDFSWIQGDQTLMVLDAKFRLDLRKLANPDDETPKSAAKRTDLYKMHTYRDALGVQAAVSVYPGDESVFYDISKRRIADATLGEVLSGNLVGIGAIAMKPNDVR
jgi:predicted component of viral defense system (DUF524 family)